MWSLLASIHNQPDCVHLRGQIEQNGEQQVQPEVTTKTGHEECCEGWDENSQDDQKDAACDAIFCSVIAVIAEGVATTIITALIVV